MTSTRFSGTSTRSVACPFCMAKPGEDCVTVIGRVPISNVHPSRSEAYAARPKDKG